MGDLIQSIPLFHVFKEMFPEAKIIYLGLYQKPNCNRLFKSIPYIDEYIEYRRWRPKVEKNSKEYFNFLRKYFRKFDLIVDTQSKFFPSFSISLLSPKYFLSRNPFFSHWIFLSNPANKVHVAAKMLLSARILGFDKVNFNLDIDVDVDIIREVEYYLKNFKGPFISIIPGAGKTYKMWPENKFADLADKLYDLGYQVIFIGAKGEENILLKIASMMHNKPIIPLIDKPLFGDEPLYSVKLFKSSVLAIGNDCGGLHLATLVGCPVIGIYGPTNPIKSAPLGKKNIVLYKNLQCSPCRMGTCKIQNSCLEQITSEEVIDTAMYILN